MTKRSMLDELNQIQFAIELIECGARLQILEHETTISRNRLIKLYKEIQGVSPPKGLLPFSIDWFITWLPNIHSSLFYNIYLAIENKQSTVMSTILHAYKLYLEQVALLDNNQAVLALTRAWTLVRFFQSNMLQMIECKNCCGFFVTYAHNFEKNYVCGICQPPSRAGKTKRHKLSVNFQDSSACCSS